MRFCLSLPRAHVHIAECEIIHCYPSLVGGSPVQALTKAWSSIRPITKEARDRDYILFGASNAWQRVCPCQGYLRPDSKPEAIGYYQPQNFLGSPWP